MAWIQIRIQRSSGSGSELRFLAGSGSEFEEYGSETLDYKLYSMQSFVYWLFFLEKKIKLKLTINVLKIFRHFGSSSKKI